MTAVAHSLQRAHRRRRSRAVAVTAVAVALLVTTVYWLSASGATGTNITAPPGLTNGAVAAVSAMSSTVTASNGGAQKDTGVTLAKLFVAQDFTTKITVSIAWTNAVNANKVLNNPNAQIVVGLYHPIATTTSGGSCPNPQVKVSDSGSYFCAAEDTTAGGSQAVSGGELFLAQSLVTGYVTPSVSGATAGTNPCTSTSIGWCQPTGTDATNIGTGITGGFGSAQRLIYAIASITVPGGAPPAQQQQLTSLTFDIAVARNTT